MNEVSENGVVTQEQTAVVQDAQQADQVEAQPEQQPEAQDAQQAEEVSPAEQEKQQRKLAEHALSACIAANLRSERSLVRDKLEAGRYAADYIGLRLAPPLSDTRDAIVQTLEGELAKTSRVVVNANDLLGGYHAFRLLAQSQGLDTAPKGKGKTALALMVPWRQYRDQWSKLIQRTTSKTEETWSILQGIEDDALSVFKASVENERSYDAVKLIVTDLCHKSTQHIAALREEETKAAKAAADKAAREAAEKVKLANQLKAHGAPEHQIQGAALEAAKARQAQEQREAEAEKKEKAEAAAKEKAAKAAKKAAAAAGVKTEPQAPAPKLQAPPAGSPPAGEQPALPVKPEPEAESEDPEMDAIDAGEECATIIRDSGDPDIAFEALLDWLCTQKPAVLGPDALAAANLALKRLKVSASAK